MVSHNNIEGRKYGDSDPSRKSYRLILDKDWLLEDLYNIPRAFDQCYSFIYCLDSKLDSHDRERVNSAFPWRGGFGYVNIYSVMRSQVPWRDRPRVKAIQKASPGWLDLLLNADVAIQVAKSVTALSGAGVVATKGYASIRKILSQIKVNQQKDKLNELEFINMQHKMLMTMCETIAMFVGFKNVQELHASTESPEVSLKLLSAHYRRTSVLLDYVRTGKVRLPEK